MRTFSKKHIVILVSVITLCALIFLVLIAPFAAIGFEWFFVKLDIDNPYVDSHFSGWKTAYIPELGALYIPAEWTLQDRDNVYCIEDESGQLWAFGAIFGSEQDPFFSYEDLIFEMSSAKITTLQIEPFPTFSMMDGSDIDKIIAQNESSANVYYCLQLLKDAETEFAWFISSDLSENEDQYNIAEAIVYSYAFKANG